MPSCIAEAEVHRHEIPCICTCSPSRKKDVNIFISCRYMFTVYPF